MWFLIRNHWTLQWYLCTKWDCGIAYIFYRLDNFWGLMWKGYIFIRSCWTDIFWTKVSEASYSSHQAMIDIHNGSKVMHRLVEMRTMQNPNYKGGENVIGLVLVEDEWEYLMLPIACWYPLHSHSLWIR